MKRLLLILLLMIAVGLLDAHEFWLRTQKYYYNIGDEAIIDFVVGENFTGEYWDMARHRVEKLELYNAAAKKDLTREVKATRGKNLVQRFSTEGGQMFVLQSNAAFLELEGEKFNDYLREDGLENMLERRTKRNELDTPSREWYTRYAKLLVQVGSKKDDVYKRKVGLKHEIIH